MRYDQEQQCGLLRTQCPSDDFGEANRNALEARIRSLSGSGAIRMSYVKE